MIPITAAHARSEFKCSRMVVVRILFEERLLRRELPDYADYTERIRYRLIPFVW